MDTGWAILLVVAAGFLFMPGMDGRADGDFWWHVLYGQKFLSSGEIPKVDWLSWTKEGQPYVVTQWLGQVLLALGWNAGGWRGTALVTWTATVLVLAAALITAKREVKSSAVAGVLTLAMTTSYWSSYARPQIFGFVCMAVLVMVIERAKDKGWGTSSLLKIAAIMTVWANLHGSFAIGLVYLGLVTFAEFAETALATKRQEKFTKEIKWGLGALAAGCAGTLVNPHGAGAWLYVLDVSQLQTTKIGVIAEWTPTALSTPAGSTFVLLSLAILVVWAMGDARPRVRDAVMMVCMFLLGMMAVRQTAFATIAMVPLAARAVAGQQITSAIILALPKKLGWSIWLCGGLIALALGQSQVDWRNRGLAEWQKFVFPVAATEFLSKHEIRGRLFNEATAGGWMEFHGQNKTFIDGRLDLHRDFEYFDWFFTKQGAPGWEERLKRTDPEIFVIQTQSPLTSLLMKSGLAAVVYTDDRYSVLLKRQERFAGLIAKLELKSVPFEIFGKDGEVKPSLCGW